MASRQSATHARLMGAIARKRDRRSVSTDPPEPTAPEGFLFPQRGSFEIVRRKPERETRIPGLAPEGVCPKRGACRRERGASRKPMAERALQGSLWRRRSERRDRISFCNSVCRVLRLDERWW